MHKKLYIKTFGCQMNEYDSARIYDLMRITQHMLATQDPAQADLIIFNTCSVREKAQEKLFSDLGRLKSLKQKNPKLIIAVGGCVATQEGENILKRAPIVDFVFGPQSLHRIPNLYQQVINEQKPIIDISFAANEKFSNLPQTSTQNISAFVTIMEGCNKYCSYCIVPYTRGKEISRPVAEVMTEIYNLIAQGSKEIYLLGQNVNDYQGKLYNDNYADLAALIHEIAQIPQIKRIRYTTSYPTSLTDRLINLYTQEPKLANHLHIPVQSGSDRILQAMRRKYTTKEFKEKITKLRAIRPDISITSDFIVGFPGETKEDFAQTLQLTKEINFDTSFSFIYSPRPGTLAAKLEDTTSLQEKKQRLQILQQQLNLQAKQHNQAMLGTMQEVLVTGFAKKSEQLTGRSSNNKIVNFASNRTLIGEIVKVKIIKALNNCLIGNQKNNILN